MQVVGFWLLMLGVDAGCWCWVLDIDGCWLQVMRGFFPSIRALAQSLLRSPDTTVVPFGGHMYRLSFITFDSYCQQVGERPTEGEESSGVT